MLHTAPAENQDGLIITTGAIRTVETEFGVRFSVLKDCPHEPVPGLVVAYTVRGNSLCIVTTELRKWLQRRHRGNTTN
jgi:hypothetical protein